MDYGIPPSAEGHISGVDIELVKNTFQINFHKDISLFNFEQFDVKYNFIDYGHKEFENNLDYSSVALSKNTNNLKVEFKSINSIMGTELSYYKCNARMGCSCNRYGWRRRYRCLVCIWR